MERKMKLPNQFVTQSQCLHAQQVLFDNGIDADETAVVLQALGCVLLDIDLEDEDLLDWEFEPIEYD